MNGITASRSVTGLEVRLHLDAALPELLGMLADAYGDDPVEVGSLLMDLSIRRQQLDDAHAAVARGSHDRIADHAAEEQQAAEAALIEAVVTEYVTVDLHRRDAVLLAHQLLAASGDQGTAPLPQQRRAA